jgi:CcmD family protein
MSNTGWLTVALVVVGLGIGGYVASISIRRRSLQRRLDELRDRSSSRA